MRFVITITLLVFGLLSCQPAPGEKSSSDYQSVVEDSTTKADLPAVVEDLMTAHQLDRFHELKAVQFDIKLVFGGNERLRATITSETNSTGVKLERSDGLELYYDGHQVYQIPAEVDYPGARFDIFTWQYFFMAPFKFADPGTKWESLSPHTLQSQSLERAKLTFEEGTGDAPDDWYIAYAEPETSYLKALAYIVTFNATQEEAEEEPHVITYHDYTTVSGIPFASKWRFWMWSEKEGLGKQLGEASISNIRVLNTPADFYELPENAKEIPL